MLYPHYNEITDERGKRAISAYLGIENIFLCMCDSDNKQMQTLFSTKICTNVRGHKISTEFVNGLLNPFEMEAILNIHRTICLERLTIFFKQSQNLVKLHIYFNFNCCT